MYLSLYLVVMLFKICLEPLPTCSALLLHKYILTFVPCLVLFVVVFCFFVLDDTLSVSLAVQDVIQDFV